MRRNHNFGSFIIFTLLFMALCSNNNALAATLYGKLIDIDSGIPLQNVTVTAGNKIAHTDNNGDYQISGLDISFNYLVTATISNYEDYANKLNINGISILNNIGLKSTPTYLGQARIEVEVTITDAPSGYAHIKGTFKNYEIFNNCNMGTIVLDTHYKYDNGIIFKNIVIKNQNAINLPFTLSREFRDGFYWYVLEIQAGNNSCSITVEYDIHYVTICHNGDSGCYHGYICDSYGVFENINHLTFMGTYNNDIITAIKFNIPPGWVRVVPWPRYGDFFISTLSQMMYCSPAVGRFELVTQSVRNNKIIIGVHERANDYASDINKWPIISTSIMDGVRATDNFLIFNQPVSISIGIPPLGTNETGWNSMYMPANNYPYAFPSALSLTHDVSWTEGRWLLRGLADYYSEIVLYKWGVWSRDTYIANLNYRKNIYLTTVYNTGYDISIDNLDKLNDSFYETTKYTKYYLFLYCLDFEIRRVTSQRKSLSDVLVYWRGEFPAITTKFNNTDLLNKISSYIGKDFTSFFNSYLFGNNKLPVESNWIPELLIKKNSMAPIINLLLD